MRQSFRVICCQPKREEGQIDSEKERGKGRQKRGFAWMNLANDCVPMEFSFYMSNDPDDLRGIVHYTRAVCPKRMKKDVDRVDKAIGAMKKLTLVRCNSG